MYTSSVAKSGASAFFRASIFSYAYRQQSTHDDVAQFCFRYLVHDRFNVDQRHCRCRRHRRRPRRLKQSVFCQLLRVLRHLLVQLDLGRGHRSRVRSWCGGRRCCARLFLDLRRAFRLDRRRYRCRRRAASRRKRRRLDQRERQRKILSTWHRGARRNRVCRQIRRPLLLQPLTQRCLIVGRCRGITSRGRRGRKEPVRLQHVVELSRWQWQLRLVRLLPLRHWLLLQTLKGCVVAARHYDFLDVVVDNVTNSSRNEALRDDDFVAPIGHLLRNGRDAAPTAATAGASASTSTTSWCCCCCGC